MPETGTIERIFLDWAAPALPATASLLTDRCARGEEVDLTKVVLALPGARAGRRLKELLLEEAEVRDLRLVPPRVTTVGALPELLYEPSSPLGDGALCRRVWARVLDALPEPELRLLFPAAPSRSQLRGRAVLAAEIDRLHRLVGGAGLRFEDVARRCAELGDALSHDDGPRWAALAEAQREYERELHALNRSDRELARMAALSGGAVSAPGEVWVVGVAEMPAVVRAMLIAASARPGARVRVLVHAPADRAGDFDDTGCVRPEVWRDAVIDVPDERLCLADGPAHQSLTLLDEMAALNGRYAADEIVVGAADEEVVPYLEQRLAAAGLPVRYAAGLSLPKTGPFRLLSACADYVESGDFDAFAALLRHPDLSDWLAGGADKRFPPALRELDAALVAADRYFSEHLPARVRARLVGRPAARRDVEVLRDALEERLLDTLGGTRRLGEWAGPILELLVTVYGGAPLDRGRPDHRRTLEACQRIRDAAAALHRLPERVDPVCHAGTAIRLLLEEAGTASIPPQADRAAIEIVGWLELHLDDAPAAIITGANDPHLPDSVNADPFLPNTLRSALGIVDNERRYARDAYQLTAMLHARESVTLIAGRRTAAGDPLRPSRLILALRGDVLARRLLRFYGDGSPHVASTAAGAGADLVAPDQDTSGASADTAVPGAGARGAIEASARRFELPPRKVLALREPLEELSVTDLRLLLEDPYRWCLERHYGLRPLDDEARELDPMAFGSLAHELLHRFARSDQARSADERAIRARLDDLLDGLGGARFGDRHVALPAVAVQIQQLRARLHAFAAWQARRVGAGWRIAAAEGAAVAADAPAAPLRAGFELDVDGEPMRIVGRIDRIDHHAGLGLWAIFDYKTSEHVVTPDRAHRRGRGDQHQWIDLQLPLYRHLARTIRGANGEALIPADTPAEHLLLGYICLPRDLRLLGHHIAEWSARDLDAADERAREAVRVARRGTYEFDPDAAVRRADGPLAALLGLKQLVTADAGVEDGGVEDAE